MSVNTRLPKTGLDRSRTRYSAPKLPARISIWVRATGCSSAAPKAAPAATAQPAPSVEAVKASEATFREAALEKGFSTHAIDGLLKKIGDNYAGGLKSVANKTAAEVEALNAQFAPSDDGKEW